MTRLASHPAAKLFPLMDDAELEKLADDIKERGLLNPIVVHEGRVLDGRNRQAACEKVGVKPKSITWDGSGGSPTGFVIAQNLHRRHLSSSQRAAIAVEALPMFEAEAKKRMSAGGRSKGRELVPDPGKATEQAAKAFGTNAHHLSDAKALKEKAPDLHKEVLAGTKTIPEAKRAQAQRQADAFGNDVERALDRNPQDRAKLEHAALQTEISRFISKTSDFLIHKPEELAAGLDEDVHEKLADALIRLANWVELYTAARRRRRLATVKGGKA